MAKTIKVALAGAGAFGIKHLDGIKNIDGVEVVSLVGRRLEPTKEIADKLSVSYDTVRYHLKHIYDKLHVTSRTAAVAKYFAAAR